MGASAGKERQTTTPGRQARSGVAVVVAGRSAAEPFSASTSPSQRQAHSESVEIAISPSTEAASTPQATVSYPSSNASPVPVVELRGLKAPPLSRAALAAPAAHSGLDAFTIMDVELLGVEAVSPPSQKHQPGPRVSTTSSASDPMGPYLMDSGSTPAALKSHQERTSAPPTDSPTMDELTEFFWTSTTKHRGSQQLAAASTKTVRNRRAREEKLASEAPAAVANSTTSHANARYSVITEQISPVHALRQVFGQGGELRKAKQPDSFYFMPARTPMDNYLPRRSSTAAPPATPPQKGIESSAQALARSGTRPFGTVNQTRPSDALLTTAPEPEPRSTRHRQSDVAGTSHFALSLIPDADDEDVFYYDVVSADRAIWDLAASTDGSDSDSDGKDDDSSFSELSDDDGAQTRKNPLMKRGSQSYTAGSAMLWRQGTTHTAAPGHAPPTDQLFTTAPTFGDDSNSDEDAKSTSSDSRSEDRGRKARSSVAPSQRTSLYAMRASVRLADGQLHNVLLLPKSSMKLDARRNSRPSPVGADKDVHPMALKSADPSPNGPGALVAATRTLNTSFFTHSDGHRTTTTASGGEHTMGVTSDQLSAHSSEEGEEDDDDDGIETDDDVSSTEAFPSFGPPLELEPTPSRHGGRPHRSKQWPARSRLYGAPQQTRMVNSHAGQMSAPGAHLAPGPSLPMGARYGSPLGQRQPMMRTAAATQSAFPSSAVDTSRTQPTLDTQRRLSQTAPLFDSEDSTMCGAVNSRPCTAPAPALLEKSTIQRMRLAAAKEVAQFSLHTIRYVPSPNWHALAVNGDSESESGGSPSGSPSHGTSRQPAYARPTNNKDNDDEEADATDALAELERMRDAVSPTAAARKNGNHATNSAPLAKSYAPGRDPRAEPPELNVFVPMARVQR